MRHPDPESLAHAAAQHASWDPNAEAWTAAVRGRAIASRVRGTDAAVLAACAPHAGLRILDVGCGEGWLSRALTAAGAEVTGVDGSAALVAAAQAASPAGGTFRHVTYDALAHDPGIVAGPFDVIVCNFALLDEDLVPLLRGLARRLAPDGRLVVQTVHPFVAAGTEGYRDGWRTETFGAFGEGFRAPMPWYFRTMATWHGQLAAAGWRIARLEEPRDADGQVLSLLLHAIPA